ncbi:hypothetical protein FRC11_014101 [Ceratobasidium sp. 423]|nr:hypothetical protein FRC11_014101 [Ceratobasidium sp. 423]
MRSIISLAIVAGLVAATPAPLTPSSRQTAYDVGADTRSGSSGPADLSDLGVLSGGSGLLGANSDIAGLHLRHVKRGLLDGVSANDVGGTLNRLTKGGGALSDMGLGIKRDHEKNKRLLNFGRPSGGFSPKGNTCPAGRRYCCKYVRKYSDPRNAGLLDGALVQDGLLNTRATSMRYAAPANATLTKGSSILDAHHLDWTPTSELLMSNPAKDELEIVYCDFANGP